MVDIFIIMSPLRGWENRWNIHFFYHHATPAGLGRSMEYTFLLSSCHPYGVGKVDGIHIFSNIMPPLRGSERAVEFAYPFHHVIHAVIGLKSEWPEYISTQKVQERNVKYERQIFLKESIPYFWINPTLTPPFRFDPFNPTSSTSFLHDSLWSLPQVLEEIFSCCKKWSALNFQNWIKKR